MANLIPVDPLQLCAEAAVEGDAVALAELVRRTQPAVWRLCTVLGSAGEEEDLVQETYVRAFSSISRYRGDAPVQIWLLSIARRVCADHVRRRQRQRQRRLLDRITAHTHELIVPAHEVADDLLEVLDADRLEAFVLTQLVGLSYQEAATVIGCPIGTVRSRVSRARGNLLACGGRSPLFLPDRSRSDRGADLHLAVVLQPGMALGATLRFAPENRDSCPRLGVLGLDDCE